MSPRTRLLFVTGTDTGVGKTVTTGFLLHHLLTEGVKALAMKPFCTGDRADVNILQKVQHSALPTDEVNPFFFRRAVAPLVAAREEHRRVCLAEVLQEIRRVRAQCDTLLVEGCGGLLAPLGEGFTLVDLVKKLQGQVLVVAPNKLGVINHILLTLKALPRGSNCVGIILMGQKKGELAAATNAKILEEICAPLGVFSLPFFGSKVLNESNLEKNHKIIKKTLAHVLGEA